MIDARVILTTIAITESASASAGSVKCHNRSAKPRPGPKVGNQPSTTPKK